MAEQIEGAQSDIGQQMAQLHAAASRGDDNGALNQAQTQLAGLANLKRDLARKDAPSLAAMRAAVAASVAVAQLLVQQVQSAPASSASASVALAQASIAARASVTDFMHAYYDQHVFDRWLTFASNEDEEEYRKREAERQREIAKAMAEHTPAGDLRANRLSIEQLKDAGAHGADRSSKYKPLLEGLEARGSKLSAQIDESKSPDPAQIQAEAASAAEDKALADAVTPEVLATLRAAKIAVADPGKDGSGVTARAVNAPVTGRAPG